MPTWIAKEVLDGSRKSGGRIHIEVRIGQPGPVAHDEWTCSVAVDGLHNSLADIRGGSSLQALCLAVSLARQLLMSFIEDGGRLTQRGTENEFDIAACFSGVGK